jgi:RNA polymerase sigma-70 factor (subfamily 1)
VDAETKDSFALFRQAQAGELTAFDRLFGRYYNRVHAIVRARLGPGLRRELESDDILNEAMIQAIQGFDKFEVSSKSKLIALFAGIVENRIKAAARHARAAKRNRAVERALDHVQTSLSNGSIRLEPIADTSLPIEKAAKGEQRSRLHEAMAQLSDDQRRAIALREYAEASWQEIAEELGQPTPDAARMFHARALVQLKKLMSF